MRVVPDYVDVNPSADATILMVHGWPGLWSNWVNQIREFEVNTPAHLNRERILRYTRHRKSTT